MVASRCEFTVGDIIDSKFQVEQILGIGSFGNVYKVRSVHNEIFALKLLRLWEVSSELHDNLLKRFEMEYQIAHLDCPYFVHAYELGYVEGNPYFIMEYCTRGDLMHVKKDMHTFLPQVARDVLLGLDVLHSSGMVHRDIKPENLMLKDNGIIALTDFGIVGDKNKRLTTRGLFSGRPKQVFGTYVYMPPEQSERKGHGVTYLPTTDFFSLGVVFYELLSGGKYPFGNLESIEELETYQYNAKHELWDKSFLKNIPDGNVWEHIIGKCLKADYKERYQSAKEILNDLPIITENIVKSQTGTVPMFLTVTFGYELGRAFPLFKLLGGHRRMLRIGREFDNDIVLNDASCSFASRYHCTLELGSDDRTWYIRDGQWRKQEMNWVPSTNGTFLNNMSLSANRTKLSVGDIITIGDLKLIVKSNY